MKYLAGFALGASLPAVLGAVIPQQESLGNPQIPQGQETLSNPQIHQWQDKYLVELGPDRLRWVTEEEKWALKLVLLQFLDLRSS